MNLTVVRDKSDGEMKKFSDYVEFKKYLKDLPTKRPFGCQYLRVLTEEIYSNEADKTYEKGALLCAAKPGTIGGSGTPRNHRCHINSDLIMNEDGSFEMKCSWNSTRIRIE